MSEPKGRAGVWTDERAAREPKGAASVWTEERGACDERRGKTEAQGRLEASVEAE